LASRRSEYDVTDRINTTDPAAVDEAVRRIFLDLYPGASAALLSHAFRDCTQLYSGKHPAYRACDTAYHNLQHVLDVSLAMARLMDGYERSAERSEPIGPALFGFGVITALFHDIGYLRRRTDTRHRNGAEYTLRHVSRGAGFLEQYMNEVSLGHLADEAARVIHFTGYEIPVHRIEVANATFRLLGNMLGSADILAQMSDRCYLEKCRDRLYPEFVAGGLARGEGNEPAPKTAVFSSVRHLICNTPAFYRSAKLRLTEHLGAACRYLGRHFDGDDLYEAEVVKNIRYAERVAERGDLSMLRRVPPAVAPLEHASSLSGQTADALA